MKENKKKGWIFIGILGGLLIIVLAFLFVNLDLKNKEVTMPLLLGLDKKEAVDRLQVLSDKIGIEIELVEVPSLEFESGFVVLQEPISGEPLKAGMKCTLSVSREMLKEEIKPSTDYENKIEDGSSDSVSDVIDPENLENEELREEVQQMDGRYLGMLYVSESPFVEEIGGQVRLELIEDGERKIVFDEYLKSNDFPKYFEIEGKTEGIGMIEMFADDERTGDTWMISMVYESR